MQRRDVLRLLATGAALQLAPHKLSALVRETRAILDEQSSPRTLNSHQFATVRTITELIIPKTNTPGATDVKTAEFIDLMLTEWFDVPDRSRFLDGLTAVDLKAQKQFAKEFVDCTSTQQSQIMTDLGSALIAESHPGRGQGLTGRGARPAHTFYAMLRQLTLVAYYTSEAGATDELHFEIVPGMYQGCSPISPAKEAPKQK